MLSPRLESNLRRQVSQDYTESLKWDADFRMLRTQILKILENR